MSSTRPEAKTALVQGNGWLADEQRDGAIIGVGTTIDPGVQLGVKGFGYTLNEKGEWDEKPHGYGVRIGPFCHIGANTVIARGSWRDTTIGWGTKIDALVFIAHNVMIGDHCLIVACTEISGSVEIGDGAILGPNVTVKERVKIGAGALIGAGAVVIRDIPAGQVWAGNPARYLRDRREGEAI